MFSVHENGEDQGWVPGSTVQPNPGNRSNYPEEPTYFLLNRKKFRKIPDQPGKPATVKNRSFRTGTGKPEIFRLNWK